MVDTDNMVIQRLSTLEAIVDRSHEHRIGALEVQNKDNARELRTLSQKVNGIGIRWSIMLAIGAAVGSTLLQLGLTLLAKVI